MTLWPALNHVNKRQRGLDERESSIRPLDLVRRHYVVEQQRPVKERQCSGVRGTEDEEDECCCGREKQTKLESRCYSARH
jgi:hypothetical protein